MSMRRGSRPQLQAEVAELLALAEEADQAERPDGLSIPEERARREKRLEAIAAAKAKGPCEGTLRTRTD